MNVGDLVGRLSVPLRIGLVVDVDATSAKVLYLTRSDRERSFRWVSFELLEIINESR